MTRWSWKAVAAVAATGGITAAGAAGAIAASADDGGAGAGAARPVIVILKDQATSTPATRARGADRSARVKALQAPLQARVRDAGGSVTHAFTTLNGFSATVSGDAAAALAKDPAVAEVLPDSTIPAPRPAIERAPGATPQLTPGSTLAQAARQGICPADPTKPLLEPEALQTTKATDANAIADGTGVKVAFVADGVDPANPDFQRPDGTPVFQDYKDFSGDGTAAPTEGAEAFGDASSIAAQGNQTYDLSQTANRALPAGCTIRIKGIAPGASLVGIKVFPEAGAAQTSTIIAGADYAVTTDDVDVLNYSLGSNPLPDEPALDALKLFNQRAVDQGVTVTISSGDAGVRNSVGSPAGEPGVLTLGASTDFRNFAQTGYGGAAFSGVRGVASDQLSQISSGGVTQNGSVVDLLAPGESGWAVCSAEDTYEGCTDLALRPSPVQSFGGTSQSAPFAAGAAAVVIDAYRKAHAGASPTPALVKQLLTGSADDIGVPSREGGAGRLDVLAAAKAASSIATADGPGVQSAGASGVITDPTQVDVAGPSGSSSQKTVTVTNTSGTQQTVAASLRELGALQRVGSGTVTLDADAPTFPDLSGSRDRRYRTATFDVPPNTGRLESRATWSSASAGVRLALIAPDGTYTAFSRPQGVSDFTEASVAKPASGTWTALIFTTADPDLAAQPGFVGDVAWSAQVANFTSGGAVSPSSLTLAPGASGQISVPVALPANAGDSDQDLVLQASGKSAPTVVPIVRRSLVGIGDQGGTFTGTITAGNGRGVPFGETDTVSFDVPQGKPALGVQLDLGNDAEQILGFLVDPDGNLVSNASNVVTTARETKTTDALSLTNANPKAGRWRLIVQELAPGSGTQEELPYTGTVSFAGPTVTTTGLPTSADTRLPAGKPVVAHVQVQNGTTGALALALDPRTATASDQRLVSDVPGDQQPVPDPTAAGFNYTVPPATDRLSAAASADQPITFDLIGAIGNPDLVPSPLGGTDLGLQYASPNLAQGPWAITPEPYAKGGFTDAPATPGTVTASLTAHTLGFDRSVATSTGDPWLAAVDEEAEDVYPQSLAPGRTGTLDATITPQGADGTVVQGTLYVTTYGSFVGSGDVVAALPYEYTIGEPAAATTPTTPTTTVTTPGETVTTPGTTVPVPVPTPGPTVTVPAPTPPAPAPSPALVARASALRLSGRTATLRLSLTRRASVKLTITRNGRTVTRAKARTLAAGTRTVRFVLGRRLTRGTYRVTVTAQVGKKVSRSRLTLRVR